MSDEQVVRFYTQARKIPFLVGKFGDFKVPGGPYTLTQAIVAFIVAWIGHMTMPLWAGGMITIVAWIPVLAVAGACGFAAGRIPLQGRNPVMLVWGMFGYATAPSWGSQAGAPVRLGPPRKIRHRCSSPSTGPPEQVTVVATEDDRARDEDDAPAASAGLDRDGPAPQLGMAARDRAEVSVLQHAPAVHQLTEVQQILAASAQRR